MEHMKKYPKVRCPVCGMCVWLRNLVSFHKLTTWVVTFGFGRGKIHYEEQETPVGLEDYWIRRLEEVIKYLQSLKKVKEEMPTSLSMEAKQPVLQSLVSPASVRFASPMKDLSLKSQKMPTLNVQEGSQRISLEETPTFVMKSRRKPSLSLKTTS